MYNKIFDLIGNTPLVKLNSNSLNNVNLYAKLEYYNPTGSLKDRAAKYIIEKYIENKVLNTEIIESSSGNFGIALSAICKHYGLSFNCVIDPVINPINEEIMRNFGAKIIKVLEPDENGGFLINRIREVNKFLIDNPKSLWVNQYENPLNMEAYYSLGKELCNCLSNIDYIFIGVSSGGTITGVSRAIKKEFPSAKVIAVDVEGSVIFGGLPKKRHIPGIGSSITPKILKSALIDDVVIVDEYSTIKSCHELMREHFICAGGSSGSVYQAVKTFFNERKDKKKLDVVCIIADRGDRYANTIYNIDWCKEYERNLNNKVPIDKSATNTQSSSGSIRTYS
jgi:cysteine synthase A